jgi:hypothetical protein
LDATEEGSMAFIELIDDSEIFERDRAALG